MMRDNRAAPPNTSQVEAAGGDLEEATENQMGGLDEEGVASLNEQIAEEQKEAAKFWEDKRRERVEESEGLAVADPLKPDTQKKDEKAAAKDDKAAAKDASK